MVTNMSNSVMPGGTAALLAHSAWVRRLAWTLVRDDALADDLAQETWLVALRHPPTDGLPARPWLSQVMRNLVRMRARGERRRAAREQATQVGAENHVDTRELVEQVETQRMIAGLVVALEEPYRSTILLRYHEGMNAADIAARQNVPAGTVRWRLKQGLDRLRIELDRRNGGDRNKWQLAIAPLAQGPLGRGGASTASFIQGALAMKALLKVVVLVAGVAAALFLARRQIAAPPTAAAVTTASAPSGRSAGGAEPTQLRAPAALPRLDKAQRAQLLQRIEHAQPRPLAAPSAASTGGAPADPGELDADYIRERIAELVPLLKECYQNARRVRPDLGGKLVVNFTIVGEPGIGGLVSESSVDAEKSTISDPGMRECVQETLYAAQFRPPAAGGEVQVTYPFVFLSGPKD
jgi:RNA polymerase sigma factor (sigma-70 family)